MDNRFHLLLTPDTVGALSRAMGRVGQSCMQAFNLRHMRCGALWQGRFKSCLAQSERYLLTSCAISNSIRCAPPWSMRRKITAGRACKHLARPRDPLITPHPLYLAMGHDQAQRAHAHRQWLDAGITSQDLQHLRAHASQERALGDKRLRMVETTLGRPATCRPRGRPRLTGARNEA
jgi:putative transposase